MSLGEIILWTILKFVLITLVFGLGIGAVLTLIERKQSAYVQDRVGPNRALVFGKRFWGSHWIGQIIAEMIKGFTKEDFDPPYGNKWLHRLGPFLALFPALMVWVVIPVGPGPRPDLAGPDAPNYFQMANLNAGLLFVFAIASISVYSNTLGAWASNSAYSLFGGLRAAAQMVSYEITLGLNLVGIFMIFGTFELNHLVWGQEELLWGWLPKWGIVVQPFAFVLFMIAAIAETKRAPFDMPEAESELVAGYFLEYSSLRFALFMLAEFIVIVSTGAIVACVFLGGWSIPWVETPVYGVDWVDAAGNSIAGEPILGWFTVLQVGAFALKTIFVIWIQMQIRWTLPRVRYDQLMKLGWVYLLPLSILNLALTALVLYLLA